MMFAPSPWTLGFLLACGGSDGKNGVAAFSPPGRATSTTTTSVTRLSAIKNENHHSNNPIMASIAASVGSTLLAASVLFGPPTALLPPPAANAAPVINTQAVSIDIDLRSVPSLTEKVFKNRDALTRYLLETASTLQPVLKLLSDSDTVSVKPPADVKGAARNLASGEAQFLLNGKELVDVRIESVPGALIVRIVDPNLPRVPFLKDGTAAMKYVDELVDAAPMALDGVEKLERAALEVEKDVEFLGNVLTWGAPEKGGASSQITYRGSAIDRFLSSEFVVGEKAVASNGEVLAGTVATTIVAAYGGSYTYYVSLQEEQERKDAEKKEMMLAKKKAIAAKAKATSEPEAKSAVEVAAVEAEAKQAEADVTIPYDAAAKLAYEASAKSIPFEDFKTQYVTDVVAAVKAKRGAVAGETSTTVPAAAAKEEGDDLTEPKKSEAGRKRKRDAIMNLFRRK